MTIIVFEDKYIKKLWPITLTKSCFNISMGSFSLFDVVKELLPQVRAIGTISQNHLKGVNKQYEISPSLFNSIQGEVLYINGRLVPDIQKLFETFSSLIVAVVTSPPSLNSLSIKSEI